MDTKKLNFKGHYSGIMDNIKSSLVIYQDESTVQGKLTKGTETYNLVGVVLNDIIHGRLSDPEGSVTYVIEAEINTGILVLSTMTFRPGKGLIASDLYSFKLKNTSTELPLNVHPVSEKEPNIIKDNQIIGTWARDDILGRSNTTIQTKFLIELGANGNYKILGAKKLDGHKDTGYSGDTTFGKWKTVDDIFYILVSGSKHWKPYAKFIVEKNKMVFVLEDGHRQVWTRIKSNND